LRAQKLKKGTHIETENDAAKKENGVASSRGKKKT
jgi:hypothetical protein